MRAVAKRKFIYDVVILKMESTKLFKKSRYNCDVIILKTASLYNKSRFLL